MSRAALLAARRAIATGVWLSLATAGPVLAGSLSAVTPSGASPGVVIQITGTGFDPTAANNVVYFGDVATATPTSIQVINASQDLRRLVVRVPAGLPAGPIPLRVVNRGTGGTSTGRSLEVITGSVTPAHLVRSSAQAVLTVEASSNAQFVAGSTRVGLGPGITVTAVVVESPSRLRATLEVAPSAAAGPRDVTVLAPTQTLLAPGAITITEDVPANQPPVVTVTAQPATISLPTLDTLLVGSVTDDGLPVGGTPSYAWSVVSGPAPVTFGSPAAPSTTVAVSASGVYVLRLTASDGALSASASATVVVNAPPQVDAGPDRTVTLPANTTTLSATVTDDGLPPGGSLQTAWTQIAGPAVASVASPGQVTTSVTLPQAGTYEFRLTASDGAASASGTVRVTVREAANQPPAVNAGPDRTIRRPVMSVALEGSASDDGLPAGSVLSVSWSQVSGPAPVTFADAARAATTVTLPGVGVYELRLTATDGAASVSDTVLVTVLPAQNAAPTVDAGPDLQVRLPATGVTLAAVASDDGLPEGSQLTYAWSQVAGPATAQIDSPSSAATRVTLPATPGSYVFQVTVADGELLATDTVAVLLQAAAPANTAPAVTVVAEPTALTRRGGVVTSLVTGTAVDDGQPAPGVLTYRWERAGGPLGVSFDNDRAPVTTVRFSEAGAFLLRLTVSDGALSASATVSVVVSDAAAEPPPPPAVNRAPVVTAIASPSGLTLPANTAVLSGSAEDDGVTGQPLGFSWSRVTGPGPVILGSPDAATTTASFASSGTYVLRLRVTDGELTGQAEVTVIVSPAAPPPLPANEPPVVTASAAPSAITLPVDTVALSGSATDDGLPEGTLSFRWSTASGPVPVAFEDANVPSTVARFAAPGVYVLRLTASDGQASSSQTVAVTVNPGAAPAPVNRPPTARVGGPYQGDAQAPVAFSGRASTDPDGDALTFSWSFGDGGQASGPAPMHTYAAAGSYDVTLTVTDGRGGTNTATTTAVIGPPVDRAPPVVTLVAPAQALPGEQVVVTADAVDNDRVAGVTFTVNGGDPTEAPVAPYLRTVPMPAVAPPGTIVTVTATARDPSGNQGSATRQITLVAAPDTVAPEISVRAPEVASPGQQVVVVALASDNVGVASVRFSVGPTTIGIDRVAPYDATIHVPADAQVGSVIVVSARATDFAGNAADASAAVTIVALADTTPPSVSLTAPATVGEGAAFDVEAFPQDNVGVASVRFALDDVPAATVATPPYRTRIVVPPTRGAGSVLRLQATATDTAGLTAVATTTTRVEGLAAGTGLVTGEVYDDTTGLPLPGVEIRASVRDGRERVAVTDARGRYSLALEAGEARLAIGTAGFTKAVRRVVIPDRAAVEVFDARLTPLGTAATVTASLGGEVGGEDGRLALPGGALAANAAWRVTRISAQGLAGLLPGGWSPVAAVDIEPAGVRLAGPASVTARDVLGLGAGMTVLVAQWDEPEAAWRVIGAHVVTRDAPLVASIDVTGQVAWLVPDTTPLAPPPQSPDTLLTGITPPPLPGDTTVMVSPDPRLAVYAPGFRAQVTASIVGLTPIASGTPLRARLVERYDFVDLPRVTPEPFVQDLVFYQVPGSPEQPSAGFVVSPSIGFEAASLAEGLITVELRSSGGGAVALLGRDGGRAEAVTGESFSVPPDLLSSDVPAIVEPLAPGALALDLPAALEALGGATLSLGGVVLPGPGVLGLPRPPGLVDDTSLLVARLIEVGGGTRLEFVAVGRVAGDRVVTDVSIPGVPASLPGVREGGRYVLLRVASPFGFVSGVVRNVTFTVVPGAVVAASSLPLVARTLASGVYVVPALAGTNEVSAIDPATAEVTAASVAVLPGGVSRLDLRLLPMAPSVTSVTPADGATDVALGTSVVVTFSEPIARATADAIVLEREDGTLVAGQRSFGNGDRRVTLRPATELGSNTRYRVRVTPALTSVGGRPLATTFTSQFRTIDLTPRPAPPAGSISATVPDANGRTTVRATQGTADLRDQVRVINLTRNTFQVARVAADGSFEVTLSARPTDKLRVSITTPGGRETALDLPRFSQENPDGSITSTVDASGGTLDGPAGTKLHVPAGAFPSGAVVTMAYLTEEQFPIRLTPGQRQVTRFVAGLRLDFGGAEPTQYLNVSFPAQPGDTLEDRWVLGAVRRVAGRDYLTVTDTARLVGGRIQTSSPPCPGVLAAATYGLVKSLAPLGVVYGTWPNPDPWAGSAGPNQSTAMLLLASTAYMLDPSATPWSLYADSTPAAPATTCFPALSGRVSVTPNLQLVTIGGEFVPPAARTVTVRNRVTGERWTYPQNIVEFKVELDGEPEDAWGAQAFKGTDFADVGFDVRRVVPGRTEIRVDMEAIAVAADTLLIFNNTRGTQQSFPREALDVTVPVSGGAQEADYEVTVQLASGQVEAVPFFVVTPRGPGNLLLRVLPVTIDPGTTTRLRNLTRGTEILVPADEIVAGRGGVEFPFSGSPEDRYQLVVSYDDGSRLPLSYMVPQVKAYAVNPRTNTVTSAYILPVPPQDEPYNLGVVAGDTTPPFIVEAPLNLQNFDPQGFVSVAFSEGLDRDSVLGGTSLRERNGEAVEIEVRLTERNRRVVIIPRAPLKLGRTYVVSFEGVTDASGNPVATPTLTLKVFEPRRIGATFTTGVYAPPVHLEPWRVKDAQGRTRVFALAGTHGLSVEEPFVSLVDITDPESPVGVDSSSGFRFFETNDYAILQGLEDVPLSAPNPCTGRARFTGTLGVQARQSQSSTLFGYTYSALDFYDLTDPSRLCRMGSKIVAGTNLGDPSVIEANGYPKGVALLPYEGGVLAYTAIQFVGLARVDLTQSIGADSPGQRARALLVPGNYRSVAITGTRIVALEQSTNTLDIFDASLTRIAQYHLASEQQAFELDIAEQFGVDADRDGRITAAEQRTLVFVAGVRGLSILDITDLSSPRFGFVPYAGGMFRVFADPVSRRVLTSTGGRFLVLDFSTPGSTEYDRDADGDGLDDRIVWRSPAGLYQGQGGRLLNLDLPRNLSFVSSGGAGSVAPIGFDTWALNSACCDLQIDLVKPADATAPSGGRAELIGLELKALKQGISAGLDKAEACGIPLNTIAIFEQGSGACIWKENPSSACASNYQPGLSDHDFEVLIPAQYLELPGDPGKCLVDTLTAEFINEDRSPREFEIDGRKVRFEDVTFFPFAKEGFDNGLVNILPPRGSGNDSDGDIGLGRQSLLLLWLLSGQYVRIEGRVFAEEPFERILQKVQSETGIPRLEGYEWANLQKFNLFKTKALLRIAGSSDPASAFHAFYVKQLHDTGKAAIRTVFARMVAHPDLNSFVWKVRRSAGDPLPPVALDGSEPVPAVYPAFDTDACLTVLAPDPATWRPKPCAGFEDYIASTAARSVLQGYDVFTAQEIFDVVHKFWRVKGDVALPGRRDIRNEAEANAFIALAARYIDESLALNLPAYEEGLALVPAAERAQRQANLQKALGNIEKKKKVSLQIVPRVSNLGFRAASDVPVVMYRGIGNAPGTRVKPKAGDVPVLVSLEGGDIVHLDDLDEYVEVEDDSADRNLLDAEILVTDRKKDIFSLGDKDDPVGNPLPDQTAEPGVVRWVAFTIDLDGPTRRVQEPRRENNYTGFRYYILDRDNPAPPAGAAAPVPLPVPDPGNLLAGDEACDPPATVLLQQRFSFNGITFPDGVPMGAGVDLEFEVSNFGQTRQSGLMVCSTLLGRCLQAGDLDPGQSRRLPSAWQAPRRAGQVLAQASVISADGGSAQAAPMLIVVGCESVLVREPSPNPNPAGPSTVGIGGSAIRHYQVVERDGTTPVAGAAVVVHVRKGNGAPAELLFTTDEEGFVGYVDDSGEQPVFRRGVHVPVGAFAAVGDTLDVSFASIDGEGDCLTQLRFTVEVVDRTYQATFAAGPALKIGGKYAGFDLLGRTAFGVEGAIEATLSRDTQLYVASIEAIGAEVGLKREKGKEPVNLGFEVALPSASASLSVGADLMTSDRFVFPLPLTEETSGKVAHILGKTITDWANTVGWGTVLPGIGLGLAGILDDWGEETAGLVPYRFSTASQLGLNLEGTVNADLFRFQTEATDKVKVGTGLSFGLRAAGEIAVVLGAEVQARETPPLIVPSIDLRGSFNLRTGFESVLDGVDDPTEKKKLQAIAKDWNDEFKASADLAGGVRQEVAIDADTGTLQSATVTVFEQKKYGVLFDDEQYFSGGDGARRSYAFKVTNGDQPKFRRALEKLVIGNALLLGGQTVVGSTVANVLALENAAAQHLEAMRLADEYEKSVELLQAKEKTYNLLEKKLPWKKALESRDLATFELKLKFDVATKYVTERGVVRDGVVFALERYPDPDPLIPLTSTDRVVTLLTDALEKSLEPLAVPLRQIATATTTVASEVAAVIDQRFSPSGVRLTVNAAAEPVKPFDVNLVALKYRLVPPESAPLVQDDLDVTGRADVPRFGIGGFFTFGPARALAAPATLEIFYLDEEVAALDESSLAIYRLTPAGTWTYVGGTVDVAANSVTTTITELGTYTVAPAMPVGRPTVAAAVTPAGTPDAVTVAEFTSDVIRLNTGQPVPDGTLFTVVTTAPRATNPVQVGTITTPDADPATPGTQVATVAGRLVFRAEYNAARPAVTVLGWPARGGTTFIDTTVSLRQQ